MLEKEGDKDNEDKIITLLSDSLNESLLMEENM
jgi:hypothetical protein